MGIEEDNWEKINSELNKLNKKYLHKHSVILNTSPPRVGKTINTILRHINDNVPVIVFVDNDKQSKDLYDKLVGIIGDDDGLYYWKNKVSSCYIMQLNEEETENNEYIINAKSEINEGVNHCKKCFYHKDCYWKWQRRNMKEYDVVLMNKHNIGTVLIDDDELFYRNGERRSIIYDEEIDKPQLTDYKQLNNVDIDLFNKIYSLTSGFSDDLIDDNDDFINEIDLIKEMLKVRATDKEIVNSDFDFSKHSKKYGKLDEKAYLEIFFNKIRVNIEIYDYLDNKPAPLPEKGKNGDYDFDLFQLEKLFIDILIDKRSEHNIILLDATPLQIIIDRIKDKVDDFKEIGVGADFFKKQSLMFRIERKGSYVKNSRMSVKTRINKNITSENISNKNRGLNKDISYITAFKINELIKEYNRINNKNAKYGVVTYKNIKFKNNLIIDVVKMLKEKDIENILYYGNYRGRSSLNDCEIIHIIGTDLNDSSASYNLYRYLDGEKSLKKLKELYNLEKHEFEDVLFDKLVKHQRNSGMEQIIFRNMAHMKKRLVIIEGYLPPHLEKYFKYTFPLKVYEEFPNSGTIANSSKRIIEEIINKFLDSVYYNKKIEEEFYNSYSQMSCETKQKLSSKLEKMDKEEARKEVMTLTKKYLSPKYKRKYKCLPKGVFDYLNKNYIILMKKAKINSLKRFRGLYNDFIENK
jgi:hypothetical protein